MFEDRLAERVGEDGLGDVLGGVPGAVGEAGEGGEDVEGQVVEGGQRFAVSGGSGGGEGLVED